MAKLCFRMLTKDGELLLDSVPFSCCNPDVLMPCKQNQIKKQLAENQTITLHTKGCKDALTEYLSETLMEKTSRLIFWTYGLAWIVFIQARYLSTTISTAILWGYPTGEAPGYLCERCPCGCCDDGGQMPPPPKKGAEDEDEEEEEEEEDTSQPSQSYSEEQEESPPHGKKKKDKDKSKKGKGKDTSKKSKPAKKPKPKKPKTKKPKMKKPKMKKMKFK